MFDYIFLFGLIHCQQIIKKNGKMISTLSAKQHYAQHSNI